MWVSAGDHNGLGCPSPWTYVHLLTRHPGFSRASSEEVSGQSHSRAPRAARTVWLHTCTHRTARGSCVRRHARDARGGRPYKCNAAIISGSASEFRRAPHARARRGSYRVKLLPVFASVPSCSRRCIQIPAPRNLNDAATVAPTPSDGCSLSAGGVPQRSALDSTASSFERQAYVPPAPRQLHVNRIYEMRYPCTWGSRIQIRRAPPYNSLLSPK